MICPECDAEIDVAKAKTILLGKEGLKPLIVCPMCGHYCPMD